MSERMITHYVKDQCPGGHEDREIIRFSVALPPRGLRRNSETQKHSWRAKIKDEYSELVWCAGNEAINVSCYDAWRSKQPSQANPWNKAHLTLVWKHCGVAPDHDNALSSCKTLIDVLGTKGRRPLGIVVDDAPAHLTVELTTEKVARRVDECVTVVIERRR